MKKSIKAIWGIGLIVVLLASMIVTAVPVSAGTLAWSTQTIPSALTRQLTGIAGTNVASLTVAPNGDLFAIDTVAGNRVYKSTNGGRTWSRSSAVLDAGAAAAAIVDIAVAPGYPADNTVVIVANQNGGVAPGQVYISTNGGASFAVLGGPLPAGDIATSIAISPLYTAGVGEIMVGSRAAGAGDVYVWGRNSVQTWAATAAPGDVTDVAFSPAYNIDGTRLAVVSAAATTVDTLVGGDLAWDATLPTVAAVNAGTAFGGATPIVSSMMAFPSNFNASLPTTRTLFVATTATGTNDDIYRVAVGSAAASVALVDATKATDNTFTSIAYSGTTLGGTLFSGDDATTAVAYSANPTAPAGFVTWAPSFAGPTGVGTTFVALPPDFATSNKVYAGTAGANSALSVSEDGGAYFYQYGMIATAIVGINDFQIASATEFYLFTNDGAGTADSLWKTTDAGATWKRVLSIVATANTAIIRLSPNYATDQTIFYGDVGSLAAGALQMSNNGGMTWNPRTPPINIGDIAVKDQYTFYIGSSIANTVQGSANGGWTYSPAAAVPGLGAGITSLKINLGTGHLLAGDTVGDVALSTNNNSTYTAQGLALGAGITLVEFDSNYGTNSVIYAANAAGPSLNKFTVGTSAAWAAITPVGFVGPAGDVFSAPDGSLYVSDASAAGGAYRSINPTGVVVAWNAVNGVPGSLPAGAFLTGLQWLNGSNVIYAINADIVTPNLSIITFTDTLTQAIPTQVAPSNSSINTSPTGAVLVWEAVSGATSYDYQISTRSDYLGAATTNVVAPLVSSGAALIGALAPGTTYYWRVRVNSPLLGPWSQSFTFENQLAPVAINAPVVAAGGEGTTGPGGWNVSVTPFFQWGPVGGATSYEFQLATDAQMNTLVVDATGANALGNVTAYSVPSALNFNTTYFWRVRAVSATSETAWSAINAFVTKNEATVAPTTSTGPAVTITTQPPATITFTQPPATATTITIPPAPAPEQVGPVYIWAIIIIGAVLVIAVIVLIVRTRRSV